MEMTTLMRPLLTPEEVAYRLNVPERTVLRWLRSGYLQGIKAGKEWRVEPAELEEFIQRQKRPKKEEDQSI